MLNGIIRPPWGVLIPLTLLLFAGLLTSFHHVSDEMKAATIFKQIDHAPQDRLNELTQELARLRETGIRFLVKGLISKQEKTVFACYNTLSSQMDHWKTLPNEEAQKYYYCLGNELAKNVDQFGPASLGYANALAEQLMRGIMTRGVQDQWEITTMCQMVITRQTGQHADGLPNPASSDSQMPLASANKSTRTRNVANKDEMTEETPDESPGESGNAESNSSDLWVTHDTESTFPPTGFFNLRKVSNGNDFQHQEQSKQPVLSVNIPGTAASNSMSSPFLDERLQKILRPELASLPTQDLMRLLNHPNWEISREAERILRERDHFQETHTQLASSLYHPNPEIRKSVLTQLNGDEQLETGNWLIELLKDPDAEVRYATAQYVFRMRNFDPETLAQMQSFMQHDSDERITSIAFRLGSVASRHENAGR
ncbi:MAG: HEAT repeat domain-containing protein [Planctomycetaceae bacterium]|nr:HEAT repeat domain-containing protein [Planctomycetaceae bacterium]